MPLTRPPLPPGPYLVAGLGKAGASAVDALAARFGPASVCAWDAYSGSALLRRAAEARALGARVELGGDGVELVAGARCVIKSPGLPSSAPLVARARELGLPVMDEIELGWRLTTGQFIGVTGTNGKSTTAGLLAHLLGLPDVAGNSHSGPAMSALAGRADPIVCEVSSYQLEDSPALVADLAVLTSHSRDHLHRHGDMESYGACKARLFVREATHAPVAVLNGDCELGSSLAAELRARAAQAATTGYAEGSDYRVLSAGWTLRDARATLAAPDGVVVLESRLPGPANAVNVAAALAAADALGVPRETSLAAIAEFPGAPGRFELVECGQPFDVVVDFAHTPDAVDHVTRAARAVVDRRSGASLRIVLSAAGTHDPGKRPEMGAIAARRSEQLVISSASLFGEPAGRVIDDLLAGTRGQGSCEVLVREDRREAFELVLDAAAPGDLVLIVGRGPLTTLRDDPSGAGPPFDDRLVAAELLRARFAPASR